MQTCQKKKKKYLHWCSFPFFPKTSLNFGIQNNNTKEVYPLEEDDNRFINNKLCHFLEEANRYDGLIKTISCAGGILTSWVISLLGSTLIKYPWLLEWSDVSVLRYSELYAIFCLMSVGSNVIHDFLYQDGSLRGRCLQSEDKIHNFIDRIKTVPLIKNISFQKTCKIIKNEFDEFQINESLLHSPVKVDENTRQLLAIFKEIPTFISPHGENIRNLSFAALGIVFAGEFLFKGWAHGWGNVLSILLPRYTYVVVSSLRFIIPDYL